MPNIQSRLSKLKTLLKTLLPKTLVLKTSVLETLVLKTPVLKILVLKTPVLKILVQKMVLKILALLWLGGGLVLLEDLAATVGG